ncbi:MAG: hypothetical protein WBK20_03585 [Spirochaetota bacterium]
MSRWLSTDPALVEGKYFPKPNDFDTEHDFYWYLQQDGSRKLPGMGGVFNALNMDVYHYAGNSPVKLVDPDGEEIASARIRFLYKNNAGQEVLEKNNNNIDKRIKQLDERLSPKGSTACRYRALQSIAESYAGKNLTVEQINSATEDLIKSGAMENNYYVNNAAEVIKDALNRLGVDINKLDILVIRKQDVSENKYNELSKKATATLRGVPNYNQMIHGQFQEIGHWQHGDVSGNLVWDPANGTSSSPNRPVNRLDIVIIKRKEE